MSENTTQTTFNNSFAPWQSQSAFNAYWSYSYINTSNYFAKVPAPFQMFARRYVQDCLYWADGWVPYFHNPTQGIFSTRLGSAIIDRLAGKVVGGQIAFKNAGDEQQTARGTEKNPALVSVGEWAKKIDLARAIKRAVAFAGAAGTSLLKVNRRLDGTFAVEPLRFDRYLVDVDYSGFINEITIFLMLNIATLAEKDKRQSTYTLEEHRYFGEYKYSDGRTEKNAPLVKYEVHKYYGELLNGVYQSNASEVVEWCDLPAAVKTMIKRNFSALTIGKAVLLPFTDWLGCELVTATEGITSVPDVPFGESWLGKIRPYLQAYDYYFSASVTDMYVGRGKVIMPRGMVKPSGISGGQAAYYTGMDDMLFQQVSYDNPESQKPLPIQFELRADDWKITRNTLLENIAVNLGISVTTLAAFLDDSAAKTAREVTTEENETAAFIVDAREIIERPINRIIKKVLELNGMTDTVEIRWSQSALTNLFMSTEIVANGINSGCMSIYRGVELLNPDADYYQLEEEYNRCLADSKRASDVAEFGGEETDDNGDDIDFINGAETEEEPTKDELPTEEEPRKKSLVERLFGKKFKFLTPLEKREYMRVATK